MEIAIRTSRKWNILDIKGNIRGKESDQIKEICNECINESKLYLVANFENVNFIDSTGLGSLIHWHQNVKSAGGDLLLMNLTENIYDLFEMTSVDKLFEILDSEDEINEKD